MLRHTHWRRLRATVIGAVPRTPKGASPAPMIEKQPSNPMREQLLSLFVENGDDARCRLGKYKVAAIRRRWHWICLVRLLVLCQTLHINSECLSFVVCVCVFFPSILDINGRNSQGHTGGRSHRIFNPPSFCGACLLSREGFSHSFPSSTVKSNFVY